MLTPVMQKLEHFVLTKFNVHRDDGKRNRHGCLVDRDGAPVRTLEWLDQRFVLFERFCLPSVVAQTCRDFAWLVRYDDVGTPPEYLRRLRAHESAVPNLRLVPESFSFRRAIARILGSRKCRLLTTRLDNDDAFQRTAVARLQRHGLGGDLEFLNLPLGYSYSYPKGRIRLRRHESNHFLSLAENFVAEPPRTAVFVDHSQAREAAPVRQIAEVPSWLEVVHGRNLTNKLAGQPCAHPDMRQEFNIERLDDHATDSASGSSAGVVSM